jgi:hypothetical protein
METLFQNNLTKEMMSALVEWHAKKPEVNFDSEIKSKSYTVKYASLGAIVKAIKPVLKEVGLSYTHLVTNGRVVTILMHGESGGVLYSERPLPDNANMQDEGARITYQKRYQLSAMLGISTEEDKDAPDVAGGSLPRATKKQIDSAITNVEKGMASGNRQVVDIMRSNVQLDTSQLRELFEAEYFYFEERMTSLVERMENAGYEVKKVK